MTNESEHPIPSDGDASERDLAAENVQSTNQPQTAPVPPSPADGQAPTSATTDADDTGASTTEPGEHRAATGDEIADAPAGTVPDVHSAPGTSEALDPVEGVHTPQVGPGGDDLDTARTPAPGRTTHAGDGG